MTTKTIEKKSDPCPCPACGKMLTSRKAVPKHTNGCSEWSKKFPETTPKEFNFHEFYKTGFWEEGFEEGVNFVRCQICYEQGIDYRKTRILHHVKSAHKLTKDQYLTLYPDALTSCSSTNAKRVATVQKRFGVDNVFQADEVKEKFDVRETSWNAETREKRAETNLERYGHENPLGGKEGHERAVEGMLNAYGEVNPDPSVVRLLEGVGLERCGLTPRHDEYALKRGALRILRVGPEAGRQLELHQEALTLEDPKEATVQLDLMRQDVALFNTIKRSLS